MAKIKTKDIQITVTFFAAVPAEVDTRKLYVQIPLKEIKIIEEDSIPLKAQVTGYKTEETRISDSEIGEE